MNNDNKKLIQRMTGVGIFSSLAFIVTLVCKLIPQVGGFLTLDAKDAVIAIASFIYGPIVAPIIALIVAFIEFITISETGPWGFLMNFASSATFSLVASLIYKFKKSINGAIIGFAAATLLTTLVMITLNPFIIPMYSGVSREIVISMIPGLLLPFNFAKTLINSAVAMLLYKPIMNACRAAGLVAKSQHKTTFNKNTVITISVSGTFIVAAIIILIIIW